MDWLFLLLAGVCEIGWPLGLKVSQTTAHKAWGIVLAAVSMGMSGYLLWLAQRTIPLGTAYAVWTGIGAAGTFIVGILVYDDPSDFLRVASVGLIIMGVIGLKLAH
ncbi:MAG: multidrug efflux SMR transporter [Spirochaetes bacterium]|nr:MAG: multidrug efflux SMR transporter [Spirochaetota bacterium]